MPREIEATITIDDSDARLGAFRIRVNELLDGEPDVSYRELHTSGRLDYRVTGRGVPYPPFVTVSRDFPDLAIEVYWEDHGTGAFGHETIQAGRLLHASTVGSAANMAGGCELRVDAECTLVFATALRHRGDMWLGYVLSATRHAYFRLEEDSAGIILEASDGVESEWAERWTVVDGQSTYATLQPRLAIDGPLLAALDTIAHAFVDEWIWFAASPLEETAAERERYERDGLKVHPVNVRVGKLKTALGEAPGGGYVLDMADPGGRAVAATLMQHWLIAGHP